MAPVKPKSVKRLQARLVLTALRNLKVAGGATLRNIHDYLQLNFPRYPNTETTLKKVIDKAVDFGAVEKKRNKYCLGGVLDLIVQGKRGRRRRKGGKPSRRRRRRRKM